MKKIEKTVIQELKEMWSGKHKISDMSEFIVNYANEKNISWMDGNSNLHKALSFNKKVYRFFNDGDDFYLTKSDKEEVKRIRLDKEIENVIKVCQNILKTSQSITQLETSDFNEFIEMIQNTDLKKIQKVFNITNSNGEKKCLFVSSLAHEEYSSADIVHISDSLHDFEEDGITPDYFGTCHCDVDHKSWINTAYNILALLKEILEKNEYNLFQEFNEYFPNPSKPQSQNQGGQ